MHCCSKVHLAQGPQGRLHVGLLLPRLARQRQLVGPALQELHEAAALLAGPPRRLHPLPPCAAVNAEGEVWEGEVWLALRNTAQPRMACIVCPHTLRRRANAPSPSLGPTPPSPHPSGALSSEGRTRSAARQSPPRRRRWRGARGGRAGGTRPAPPAAPWWTCRPRRRRRRRPGRAP